MLGAEVKWELVVRAYVTLLNVIELNNIACLLLKKTMKLNFKMKYFLFKIGNEVFKDEQYNLANNYG